MVIAMQPDCRKSQVGQVIAALRSHGLEARIMSQEPRMLLGVVEEMSRQLYKELVAEIEQIDGVEEINSFDNSWKLVSKHFHPEPTMISLKTGPVGGKGFVVMAGPCAVESREGFLEAARAVAGAGAGALRGGAFKPRTSPYSFRGMGEDGLKIMAEAREETGLPICTEVLSASEVELVARYADVLQIGTRNMQNFSLLEAVGDTDRPVLLKRGMVATIKEFLLSAEYILARGNSQVMLCERGVRTFETETRNTLDISAVAVLKEHSHLPVIVDPSHAAGKRELVPPLARAALAVGADGIIVEVHPRPEEAFSDGRQSLTPSGFQGLMGELKDMARVMGKELSAG